MTPETHVRNLADGVMRGKLSTRVDWPGRVSLLDVRECARAIAFAAADPRMLNQTVFAAEEHPERLGHLFREAGRLTGRRAGDVPVPSFVRSLAFTARRVVPFALKSALLDVLCVDVQQIHELGFRARERGRDYLVPLLHDVRRSSAPVVASTTALITGAASGIGRELAVQMAADGYRTIWVDRDPRVAELACAIPDAASVVADLSTTAGVERVTQALRDPHVRICVNCAGVGTRGALVAVPEDTTTATINVNVVAMTAISRFALEQFDTRGGGVLVNVASSSAFMPLPGMAVYAATKAYILSLTEALGEEAKRGRGGSVAITVCPSGVKTNFQRSANVQVKPREVLLDPAFVAARMRTAIGRQRGGTVFIGWPTRVMALSSRLMPRAIGVRLTGRLFAEHR
jgi:short-subunit dehydrogenase